MPPCVVEYDAHGKRVSKFFAQPHEARRFYASKLKAGKNPQVKAAT